MRTTRAALFLGAAILSTPAFAQDTPQQVTPPPIMTTPAPAPAPAPSPQVVIQPSAPVVQSVPSVEDQQRGAAAADAPAPATRRTIATRTTTTRTTTAATRPAPVRQAAPAPAAETPAAAPAAPVQENVPAPLPPQAEPAPAPDAVPVAADSTTTTTTRSAVAWPWLLGGLVLVIAGLAVFLLSRRRRNDEAVTTEPAYVEPAYVAPVAATPIAEPVAAPEAAVIAQVPLADERIDPRAVPPAIVPAAEQVEEAEIAEARKDDLAGVADADAPVSNRPWIELGLRPVSAGTTEEEAMVDFELTVGNSGDIEARNVRISSFMLAEEGESTEMERMLMEHRSDTIVPPVSIDPGDGTRVDAHLAVPKGELGRTFNPVVVAEARYTLPDGSEARTAAAFRIGRPAYEGGIGAIGSSRPHVVEDLAAELYGQPEHA